MDPIANLKEQVALAKELEDWEPGMSRMPSDTYRHNVERLVELVLALDGWVQKGSPLPTPKEEPAPYKQTDDERAYWLEQSILSGANPDGGI